MIQCHKNHVKLRLVGSIFLFSLCFCFSGFSLHMLCLNLGVAAWAPVLPRLGLGSSASAPASASKKNALTTSLADTHSDCAASCVYREFLLLLFAVYEAECCHTVSWRSGHIVHWWYLSFWCRAGIWQCMHYVVWYHVWIKLWKTQLDWTCSTATDEVLMNALP